MLLKVSVRREGKIEGETAGDPASVPRPGTAPLLTSRENIVLEATFSCAMNWK